MKLQFYRYCLFSYDSEEKKKTYKLYDEDKNMQKSIGVKGAQIKRGGNKNKTERIEISNGHWRTEIFTTPLKTMICY